MGCTGAAVPTLRRWLRHCIAYATAHPPGDPGRSPTKLTSGNIMNRHRRGLTLLESIVCIGIIAILVAVSIPAVQRMRETCRLTTCQNNLRQSVLAIQSFHTKMREIPSLYNGGFMRHPRNQGEEYDFHSWQAAVLPELGYPALHDQLDFTSPTRHERANKMIAKAEVSVFICPSTSNYTLNVPIWGLDAAARSDYQALGGVFRADEYFASQYVNRPLDFVDVGVWGRPRYKTGGDPWPLNPYGGIPPYAGLSRTTFADVTDGLSNTLMIGEVAGGPDIYRRGKPDEPCCDWDPHFSGQPAWANSVLLLGLAIHEQHGVNDTNQQGLYSFHDIGANVALADGSVRLLANSIDKTILHGLLTSAGSEVAAFE